MGAASSMALKTLFALKGTRREIARHSVLKGVVIAFFVVLFEGGLGALFMSGFRFLSTLSGTGLAVIPRLFALFFLGLGFMLVLSSILSAYATMYRSDEVAFLMVRPYTVSQVLLYKFLESALLSSWALFFIIVPFMGTYARHQGENVLFAVWTLLFSVPFVLLCTACGTILTLLLVRWSPRGRILVWLAVMGLAFAIGIIAFAAASARAAGGAVDEGTVMLNQLLPGSGIASCRFLPSWLVAEGILSLSKGEWGRGLMLWLTLASTAAVLVMAVETLGRRIFFEGWQRVLASGDDGASRTRGPLLPWLDVALRRLPSDVRAMLVKDARTLIRDPMQWSQFLVFFGLLGIYFASLRSLRYHTLLANWRTVIAVLNIFSVSTVVSSLAARFVYPQLSLEGQGFWVLGLSPTSMRRILYTKFAAAFLSMGTLSVGLMWLSTGMLAVGPLLKLTAIGLAVAVSLVAAATSTGLGAVFMDLEQRNAAAIVSGFGGTLNLVLGLGFIIATVAPFGSAMYLWTLGEITRAEFHRALLLCSAWTVVLTAIAAAIPLHVGLRALQAREY